MNPFGSHPPVTLPIVDTTYTTTSGGPMCERSSLNRELKYCGSQNRKNHHTGSVRNFPAMNPHACLYLRSFHQAIVEAGLVTVTNAPGPVGGSGVRYRIDHHTIQAALN